MSKEEIDAYLETLDEPKRATLRELRQTILGVIPEAEQCISYGMPAFRLRGKIVAGFAAFKNHLSYFPHSGSVIPALRHDVAPQRQAIHDLLAKGTRCRDPKTRRFCEGLLAH